MTISQNIFRAPRPATNRSSGADNSTTGRLALAVGVLDASVVIAYALGVDPIAWHAGTLAVKIALLLANRIRTDSLLKRGTPFILLAIALSSLTLFNPTQAWGAGMRNLGFILHITATLALLRADNFANYLKAVGATIACSAVIHIVLSAAGTITNHYGRFYYLGDNHPNLGGEINAVGGVAIALVYRRRTAMVLTGLLIASDLFMQSRASMIVLSLILSILIVFDANGKVSFRRIFALLIVILLLGPLLIFSGIFGNLTEGVSTALLLNDRYRGVGTGFVGRDIRWLTATRLISEHPFVGVGPGYFETMEVLTPHNFFLYALAENGILGAAALFSVLAFYILGVLRRSMFQAAILGSLLVLAFLNDRFMNINPYPFVFFITLIALGGRSSSDARMRSPRVPC